MKNSTKRLLAAALAAFSLFSLCSISHAGIVGTDLVEAAGDYSKDNATISFDTRANTFGLTANAGVNYVNLGIGTTSAKVTNIRLTSGFSSGHTVAVGTYTASIDLGQTDRTLLNREPFQIFEFKLVTVESPGTEIGTRNVITPYTTPAEGEWSTATISYEVSAGNALIGETLTWAAYTEFDTTSFGKFGAFDNVQVSHVPEPSTYGLLGGLAALAVVMLRRRRSLR